MCHSPAYVCTGQHCAVHRKVDVERMLYDLQAPVPVIYEDIFIFIDPAAGGPCSDYGIMSVTRSRGIMVVRCCGHEISFDFVILFTFQCQNDVK